MHDFSGRKILITGASSGIGLAGALAVTRAGGRVIATGRNQHHLKRLKSLLPQDSIVVCNDAGNADSGKQLDEVVNGFGQLDGLWLNAGYASIQSTDEIEVSDFDAIMAANVRGPVLQLTALRKHLACNASVVVTASTSAYEGAAMTSLYAATKGALISLVRCWATELGEKGIRVNTLVPGPIKSDFRHFMEPEQRESFEASVVSRLSLKRIGSPLEAANVALFLLSTHSSFITGSQYVVDGGLTLL